MRQVVCLSGQFWADVPTRTQQLMSRMKDAEVLYFAPPAADGDKSRKAPGRKLRPGLIAYTLPPAPPAGPPTGFLARWVQSRNIRFLQSRLERHHFHDPLLWCSSPGAAAYLDALAYRGLVYDCDRYWPEVPEQWESELTAAADVVFAASPDLADHLVPCNRNVTLLPNGCNYPMFARDALPRPKALADLTGPILGWAGTIWADLELAPLLKAARSHPDCTVVLVGRMEKNPLLPALLAEPNVRFLDFVPPVELPDYLCNFDVCLSLLRRSHQDDDVLPARIFEYLSTGKPIVAMLAPDQVEVFPDVIYSAQSPAEFSLLCTRALDETGSWARDRRRAYGRAAAWSQRAGEVNRILESIGLF